MSHQILYHQIDENGAKTYLNIISNFGRSDIADGFLFEPVQKWPFCGL